MHVKGKDSLNFTRNALWFISVAYLLRYVYGKRIFSASFIINGFIFRSNLIAFYDRCR